MPLDRLYLSLPANSDLKPLTGMTRRDLKVVSDLVTDLTPLKEMPLERITLVVHPAANVEVLRSISTLRFFNDKPVDVYWSENSTKVRLTESDHSFA